MRKNILCHGIASVAGFSFGLMTLATSATSAAVVFDNGQNLNLLKSDLSSVTASAGPAIDAANLVGRNDSSTAWQDTFGAIAGDTTLTVDLGAVRSVGTIKLWETFGGYGLANGTISTSTDNITYVPQAATFSNPNTQNTRIALTSPATAQYVKITGTDYLNGGTSGSHRWIANQLQVLGATGPVVNDGHLNLISGTAFNTSPTLTLSGISVTATTPAEFIDDALNPLVRGVMFSLDAGDSFTVDLMQPVELAKIGLHVTNINSGTANAAFQFLVETSSDNLAYAPVLSQTGVVAGANFFSLVPSTARYLKLTVVDPGSPTIYIGDISAFSTISAVPEPTMLGLAGLGGAALLGGRRRRR